jgi:hypothetical protein
MMNRKLIWFNRDEEVTNASIAHMERKQHEVNSEYPEEIQEYYNIYHNILEVRHDQSLGNDARIPVMLEKMKPLPADLFCEGCLLLLFRSNRMLQQEEMIIQAMESTSKLELDSRSLDWILKKVILELPIDLADRLGMLDKDANRFAKVKFEAFIEEEQWEKAFDAALSIPEIQYRYRALEYLFQQTTVKAVESKNLQIKTANQLGEIVNSIPNKDISKEESIRWQIQALCLSGKEDEAYNFARKQKNRSIRAYALALVGEAYCKSKRRCDADDAFIRAYDIAFKLPQPEKEKLIVKIATSQANGGQSVDAMDIMDHLVDAENLKNFLRNIFKAHLDWKFPDIALHTLDCFIDIDEYDSLIPQLISVAAEMGKYPLALCAAGRILEEDTKAYALLHLSEKMAGDGLLDLAEQTFQMAYDAVMDVGQEPLRTVIHNKVASSLIHLDDYQNAIGMVYLHSKNESLVAGLKQLSETFLKTGHHEMAFQTAFMALINVYLDKLMDSPIEVAFV